MILFGPERFTHSPKFIYQNCHEKKSTSDLDYFFLNWSVALMYTRNWSSNHFQNVAREWKPTTVTPKCRDVYSRTGIHNQQNMDPRLFQGGSSSISVSRNIFWLRIMFFYIIWLEKPQKTVFFFLSGPATQRGGGEGPGHQKNTFFVAPLSNYLWDWSH